MPAREGRNSGRMCQAVPEPRLPLNTARVAGVGVGESGDETASSLSSSHLFRHQGHILLINLPLIRGLRGLDDAMVTMPPQGSEWPGGREMEEV